MEDPVHTSGNDLARPDTVEHSDEESPGNSIDLEDAQSLVGVSISRVQSELLSPRISYARKNAILAESQADPFDHALARELSRRNGEENTPHSPLSSEHSSTSTLTRPTPTRPDAVRKHPSDGEQENISLPSPWHPEAKAREGSRSSRSTLRLPFRPRSSSGPTMDGSDESKSKRLLPFSFPSLPLRSKFPSPRTPPSPLSSRPTPPSPNSAKHEAPLVQVLGSGRTRTGSSPLLSSEPIEQPSTLKDLRLPLPAEDPAIERGPSTHLKPRPRVLRRVTSDSELTLRPSISTTSSLGDDARFDDVREQVNSRFKALRDSFADSNFKLPSIPSLPNLSLPSFSVLRGAGEVNGATAVEAVRTKGVADGISQSALYECRANLSSGHARKNSLPVPLDSKKDNVMNALSKAMKNLRGDIVILGGYRGSVLRSAKPPHRQLWIPVKVGLNLRRVDLEVGLDPEDEEYMHEKIIPSGMLTHIGPVDISRRLFKRLRACANYASGELRVWNYGYDWRLSPHLLSQKLVKFIESLPCNQAGVPKERRGAMVIAHSLGGLLTRHAVNQRPELFAGVVYAGVPQTCVNILGPLRNGDEVLLSSRVLTAQVNFTIRTSFVFLPEDGRCFIDKHTGEEYPLDFFDVKTWAQCALSPCMAPPLPPLNGNRNGLGDMVRIPLPGKKALAGLTDARRSPSPKGRRQDPAEKVVESVMGEDDAGAKSMTSTAAEDGKDSTTFAPQMQGQKQMTHPTNRGANINASVSTAVTIPPAEAERYLQRTLAEALQFKRELRYEAGHAQNNLYPPVAVLYGKSVPTVCGAKVAGRDGIRRSDAYDDLAFASGDGVCLARAAMLPPGYRVARGGRVSSDRGHVTLLGDLEAVGRCLGALIAERNQGVGLGRGGSGGLG